MRRPVRSVATCLAWLACTAAAACTTRAAPNGLELLTSSIDTSATLGAWTKAHPHDLATHDAPAGSRNEYICRAAEAPADVAGGQVTRYALFYIPDAPPGEAFPADTVHFAAKECALRAIWAVREVNDTAAARQFADTLEHALAARLGAGNAGAEITGPGTGSWQRARSWAIGTTRVVLGIAPANEYRSAETNIVTRRGPRVIVAAYAPHSGLAPASEREVPSIYGQSHYFLRAADDKVRAEWIDSTLALPGIPANVVSNLKRVLAYARTTVPDSVRHTASIDSALVRAVVATRDSVPRLPLPARAATLLAVDFAIETYAGTLEPDTTSADTRTRRTLLAAGVDYTDARGPVFVYTRPWLWEAYRTDSTSAGGRIAFLELLANGWTTKPDCADGRNGYDRVIAHGEAALAAGNTDPMIHLFVGEAYRDIYSLAHGAGGVYARASDFAAKAEPARQQAIEHLATALRGLRQQPVRHAAWDDAIRLVLGAHTETSFFCFF
jgi:hypothetical protein